MLTGRVVDQIRSLNKATIHILEQSLLDDRWETSLRAIREARANMELVARISGELRPMTAADVTISGQVDLGLLDQIMTAGPIISAIAVSAELPAVEAVSE